jgi:UDP-N-acetylglucosamine:LPS N-acetylglucosamine transferase
MAIFSHEQDKGSNMTNRISEIIAKMTFTEYVNHYSHARSHGKTLEQWIEGQINSPIFQLIESRGEYYTERSKAC